VDETFLQHDEKTPPLQYFFNNLLVLVDIVTRCHACLIGINSRTAPGPSGLATHHIASANGTAPFSEGVPDVLPGDGVPLRETSGNRVDTSAKVRVAHTVASLSMGLTPQATAEIDTGGAGQRGAGCEPA